MDIAPEGPVTIERCDPARHKNVLALAALVWPEALRAGHWQAISASLSAGNQNAVILLAAWKGDRLVGAALAQPLPGKAALVWSPQVLLEQTADEQALGAQLLAGLCDELQRLPIRIAQTLLSPDDPASAIMQAGGFTPAAELSLDKFVVGDKVEFTFEVRWKERPGSLVTSLTRLPPETELDFGRAPANRE